MKLCWSFLYMVLLGGATESIAAEGPLKAELVVESVVVKGSIVGKARYRTAYGLAVGAFFDESRHEAGCAHIRKLLRDEGYFAGTVRGAVDTHEETHMVRITLHIATGKRFKISATTLTPLAASGSLAEKRLVGRVERMLERSMRNALLHGAYDRVLIDTEMRRARELLRSHGWLSPAIELKECIKYETKTVSLNFSIILGPRTVFEFCGNRFFTRQQLLDHILLFGGSVSAMPVALLADEIVHWYKEHGFWDVSVSVQDEKERTFFCISEGKRVHVGSIEIQGLSPCPGSILSASELIRLHGGLLFGESYFDDQALRRFLEAITEQCVEWGFWDVELVRCEYVKQKSTSLDCDEYKLIVELREGYQRRLRRVEADASMPIPLPAELVAGSDQKPFSLSLLKKQRTCITQALRACGYLYVTCVPDFIDEQNDGAITVRWRCVGMQERVTFGKTLVRGLPPAQEHLVLRELCYQEGDVWNQDALESTKARLRSLGIFDTFSLMPDDAIRPEPVKLMIAQGVLDAPHELRARIGVQGVNRNVVRWYGGISPKVGISYLAKNPLGNADIFCADIDYSRYIHDIILSYRSPWLYGRRVGAEFQFISSRYDQPLFIGSPEVLYRASRDGMLYASSSMWGECKGGVSIGIERLGVSAVPCGCCRDAGFVQCRRTVELLQALDINPRLFNKGLWYAIFEATAVLDRRDDKVNPSTGYLTVFSAHSMVPPALSEGATLKLLVDHAWFQPTYAASVLAWRIRAGAIMGAPLCNIIPIERFYLGGSRSLRSYNDDYAPPLNPYESCKHTCCLVPTGGVAFWNGNIEARVPVRDQLVGVLLCDVGSLAKNELSALVQPHNCMVALGWGLRYLSPVGPVRFDIAWKIQRDTTCAGVSVQDKRYAWFVTLGHAF